MRFGLNLLLFFDIDNVYMPHCLTYWCLFKCVYACWYLIQWIYFTFYILIFIDWCACMICLEEFQPAKQLKYTVLNRVFSSKIRDATIGFGLSLAMYCWWKKSCTTWDVRNPENNGTFTISTGRFLPSTVVDGKIFLQISPKNHDWFSMACLFTFQQLESPVPSWIPIFAVLRSQELKVCLVEGLWYAVA